MRKKNMLFISISYDPNFTGGTKVDSYIVERLKQSDSLSVKVLTDEILQFENKSNLAYNFKYLSKVNFLKNFDYIIINSRLYPRLFLVIGLIKFFCRNTKILFIHHHFDFETRCGYKKIVSKKWELFVLKKADGIIVVSPYILDMCKRLHFSKPLYYLEISFGYKKRHQKPEVHTNDFLFVGTVEYRKGVDKIIEAVSLLNSEGIFVTINIVGKHQQGGYYASLMEKINKENLTNQIKFLGRISDEELEKYYTSAYAFVFPSRHEGYGMALVEAMSYGLPVIVFNNSAMPYTVKNEKNGLLVKTDDTIELKEAIKRLVADIDLRNRLSAEALKYYENTRTYEDWNKDIDNFINTLC